MNQRYTAEEQERGSILLELKKLPQSLVHSSRIPLFDEPNIGPSETMKIRDDAGNRFNSSRGDKRGINASEDSK